MSFITATPRTINALKKADALKPETSKYALNGSLEAGTSNLLPKSHRYEYEDAVAGFELHGEFCPRLTDDSNEFFVVENDLYERSAEVFILIRATWRILLH